MTSIKVGQLILRSHQQGSHDDRRVSSLCGESHYVTGSMTLNIVFTTWLVVTEQLRRGLGEAPPRMANVLHKTFFHRLDQTTLQRRPDPLFGECDISSYLK